MYMYICMYKSSLESWGFLKPRLWLRLRLCMLHTHWKHSLAFNLHCWSTDCTRHGGSKHQQMEPGAWSPSRGLRKAHRIMNNSCLYESFI